MIQMLSFESSESILIIHYSYKFGDHNSKKIGWQANLYYTYGDSLNKNLEKPTTLPTHGDPPPGGGPLCFFVRVFNFGIFQKKTSKNDFFTNAIPKYKDIVKILLVGSQTHKTNIF